MNKIDRVGAAQIVCIRNMGIVYLDINLNMQLLAKLPFQLEVVSDFTAFHALVMEDCTAAVAEVTLDFTAEKLFWMLTLMVFHVLLVLVVMELHADFIAALTPAVPVRTVWLMAVQL